MRQAADAMRFLVGFSLVSMILSRQGLADSEIA